MAGISIWHHPAHPGQFLFNSPLDSRSEPSQMLQRSTMADQPGFSEIQRSRNGPSAVGQSRGRPRHNVLRWLKALFGGLNHGWSQRRDLGGSAVRPDHSGFDVRCAPARQLCPKLLTQRVVWPAPISHLQGQLKALMAQVER